MERKVERLIWGDWQNYEFKLLKRGDIFRLFDTDGYPVSDSNGGRDFQAESDAYINKNGHWEIEIEESLIQM